MEKLILLAFMTQFVMHGCKSQTPKSDNQIVEKLDTVRRKVINIIDSNGLTIEQRFNPPINYKRVPESAESYGFFLRTLKLKPVNTLVKCYNGATKNNYAYCSVVDLPIGNKNLHQCADAVMRLRADYLYSVKRKDEISFNYTNGFAVNYDKWKSGYRTLVKGNKVEWVKQSEPVDNKKVYWNYLENIFMYAGTLSLSKELTKVDINDMQIGDVFIIGGSPGHAITVVDMAIDSSNGEKLFILAQSYMPAQELQILRNLNNSRISPWYKLSFPQSILETPEWTFSDKDLMQFVDKTY